MTKVMVAFCNLAKELKNLIQFFFIECNPVRNIHAVRDSPLRLWEKCELDIFVVAFPIKLRNFCRPRDENGLCFFRGLWFVSWSRGTSFGPATGYRLKFEYYHIYPYSFPIYYPFIYHSTLCIIYFKWRSGIHVTDLSKGYSPFFLVYGRCIQSTNARFSIASSELLSFGLNFRLSCFAVNSQSLYHRLIIT